MAAQGFMPILSLTDQSLDYRGKRFFSKRTLALLTTINKCVIIAYFVSLFQICMTISVAFSKAFITAWALWIMWDIEALPLGCFCVQDK